MESKLDSPVINENRYTDRELLLLVVERQRVQAEFFERLSSDLAGLSNRVAVLERESANRSGFFRGAQWLWGFLTSGAGATLGYLLGQRSEAP